MKTIIFIAVFCSTLFAQSWNNPADITEISSSTKIASCVDKNGIQTIFWTSGGSLQFVKINSDGTCGSIVTIDNSVGVAASIASYNDVLYAVYEKSGAIKIANSTNNGANWNTSFASRNTIASTVADIATATDARGIHIAWAENNFPAEVYYERYQTSSPNSGYHDYKNVTDGMNENGLQVSIALSSNEVHVGYSPSPGYYLNSNYDATRDFVWGTNTWESTNPVPKDGYTYGYDLTCGSYTTVVGSTVHVVYHGANSLGGNKKLLHFSRPVNGTTWTYDANLNDSYTNDSYWFLNVILTTTAEGNLHMVYRNTSNVVKHLIYSGTTWTDATPTWPGIGTIYKEVSINGYGNDLYVTYNYDESIFSKYKLRYRQYDAAPTVPQNPATSVVNVSGENYPKVSWAANPEPDVYNAPSAYEVWRRDDNTGSGNWTAWALKATLSGSTINYTDMQLPGAGFGPKHHEYKLRAKDIGTNLSNYSSVVTIRSGAGAQKYGPNIVSATPTDFSLGQNYPNPFNPATTIEYQIPNDENVILKVYSLLGSEVATLVNGFKVAGYHEIHFDASSLSSGTYIYRLTAGKYSEIHKMTLMK